VATLDEFIALNDQLAAATDAGLPLPIDLGADATPALERINALIVRQTSRGASLEEAINAAGPELPPQYRSLVLIWLRSGDQNAVLDRASELGEALEDSREDGALALVYPITVLALALAGMAAFCLFVLPKLQGFRESMRLSLGQGADVLDHVARFLPVWGVAGAIVVVVAVIYLWRSLRASAPPFKAGWWARLTGQASADSEQRTAAFADWSALLSSAGVPEDEYLLLASKAAADDRLQRAAVVFEGSDGERGTDNHERRLQGFPPFLRWALTRTQPTERTQALRVAADVYRDSARRLSDRNRTVVPLVAGAVIGGGAVLVYGLSLFVPLTEILQSVAALH
jgi:type II secretory pathway component PulF